MENALAQLKRLKLWAVEVLKLVGQREGKWKTAVHVGGKEQKDPECGYT